MRGSGFDYGDDEKLFFRLIAGIGCLGMIFYVALIMGIILAINKWVV